MTYYDEQLREFGEQCARKKHLEAMLAELREQRQKLSDKVRELGRIKLSEEADVEKLEGRSLAVLFIRMTGKLEEKLDKERQEAYAARVKYDAAVMELASVDDDIDRCAAEFKDLRGCEERYAAARKEKADAIKAAGGAAAEEILKIEERIAYLDSQKTELREAVSVGRSALNTAEQVVSSLGSAEGWGTWDLLGGGLISDLAKHSHLDNAQSAVERLQVQLRRFKTELADVTVRADIQVNVDGFLRFADYFFDGLFADWAVLDKIGKSKDRIIKTKIDIKNVIFRLDSMTESVERERAELKVRLDTLVREARI